MIDYKLWTKGKDYPTFMVADGLRALASGYLVDGETPKSRMKQIARQVELETGINGVYDDVYEALWKGWIGLASPVWSNFARVRGLPISCFGSYVEDSILGFFNTSKEVAIMNSMGGGTSGFLGDVRSNGEKISHSDATADGVMTPTSILNNAVKKVSQGGVRRGMMALYLPFSHKDIMDFLEIREIGNEIQTITNAVCISKQDVDNILAGDEVALKTWARIQECRNNLGVPYIIFTENANNHVSTPAPYQTDHYEILASNLCNEIYLPSSKDESFVCCLSSLNLAKYDEWKDTNVVDTAVILLDAVMSEFIRKASKIEGMEKAVNFANKHRALGLGVYGEHTYLQERSIPFGSIGHESFIRIAYKNIKEKALKSSEKLADLFGACEVNAKFNINRRNTTLLAIAPTTTNALIGGDVSAGIEPIASNVVQRKVAKSSFTKKNETLKTLLSEKGFNDVDTWDSIIQNFGSVQHLDCLDDEEKQVFKTAYEINQYAIIKMASLRQNYLCQGQSLNLFILPNATAQSRSELCLTAYFYGLKGLYYQRSESTLKEGKNVDDVKAYMLKVSESAMDNSCLSCDG